MRLSEEDEEEDQLASDVEEDEGWEIAIPGSDDEDEVTRGRFEKEFAKSEKLRRQMEKKRRDYRDARGPGYSNPRKN